MAAYIWLEAPGEIEVRCPRCGGRAAVDAPFEFYSTRGDMPDSEHTHKWGGWVVVEKYPSAVRWPEPPVHGEPYDMREDAVVKCSGCHFIGTHRLDWPADAYYQWDIRGHTLWAWSREHALAILAFVESGERDETKFGVYAKLLRTLPSEFISAKVRDLVVKRIRESL